jgi:uncharacterized protein YciI
MANNEKAARSTNMTTESAKKRFAYFYFMKREPKKIQAVVHSHIAHWKESGLSALLDGPFADHSGGLITFEAKSLEEATAFVIGDPFETEGLLDSKWIKEWIVE